MKKTISYSILMLSFIGIIQVPVRADGAKQAAASFVLPTTGQYMNGEFNEGKTNKFTMLAAISISHASSAMMMRIIRI